jgi:two-component system, NtrC family, nitrogen regulation sensor histidine kinase NtrY
VLTEAQSEKSFPEFAWKAKTNTFEIDEDVQLELVFVISKDFLSASDSLRDLVLTLENVSAHFQPLKMGYYRLFLIIYVWILAAAVLLGLILARSVTRRVSRLAKATKNAAQGDLTVRVPVRGNDEIGSLSKSFNLMLNEIQQGRDRIVYLEKVSSWQEIARRLAHEIKNPLTPIQLAVQELHRSYRGDDPAFLTKLNDSLEIVEEEVGNLRRMVETFSEFAKMPDVQPVPMDLVGFVSDFLKFNPHLSSRVKFTPPGEPIPVSLDRTLMGRVLTNLIANGLDASTPDVAVEIRVSQGTGWGTLQVLDRGAGLSKEARSRLFQPYFTTKTHGTGLGLAIVKKIVLQHGGEISAEDNEGGGTVFVVRLRSGASVAQAAS